MKAYLIDPSTRRITEVQYTGDVSTLYAFQDISSFASAEFNEQQRN